MPEFRWTWIPAIILVFALVVLTCFYTIDRFTGLLGIANFWVSLMLAIALTVLLPLVMFLPGIVPSSFTNGLWVLVSTAFGLLFGLLSFLLVFEIVNLVVDLPGFESGLAIAILMLVIAIASFANANRLVTRTVRLESFQAKVRAVQLTDIHIGSMHGKGYLKRVVDTVNSLDPDIVFITGDILSGATKIEEGMFDEMNRVKARVIMVPGNHEYYDGIDDILRLLSTTKVELIRDEVIDMGAYQVLALDYAGDFTAREDIPEVVLEPKPVIVLSHIPGMRKLPEGSLILSGHYHAGQIFPLNFLAPLLLKYARGLHEKDGVHIYVSPGTATWGPPMRFGSTNEVTLLELG